MARPSSPARSLAPLIIASGISWLWAFCLLAAKEYEPLRYYVSQHLPPLWGFFGGSLAAMAIGVVAALLLIAGCFQAAERDAAGTKKNCGWLLLSLFVPLFDVAILCNFPLPGAYLVPIGFALLTGLVSGQLVGLWKHSESDSALSPTLALSAVWLLAIAAGSWWYWQGVQAYDNYLLGYSDFGHFAVRVANTWEGRGFLKQGPDLPIFWDHFNPGLALLAPLWGLWSSAKLFILIQAGCLALPAPLIFGIARRLGFSDLEALLWSVAYLALPATGQLNVNYGYGWHPESVALPLLFGAAYALLREQRVAAALLALLAASFAEVVIVALGCIAFATALDALFSQDKKASAEPTTKPWTRALPAWAWFAVWLFFTAAFVVIHQAIEASQFQEGRFATLGKSGGEILLSPILKPHIFWAYVLRPRCLYFVLAVFAPLGLVNIGRSRWLALATVPPLLVLLAWKEPSGTSLAFQYTTTLIPLGLLAAMVGARRMTGPDSQSTSALPVATSACVAALTLSTFIGALPWSSPTLHVLTATNYPPAKDADARPNRADERAPGSPGHAALAALIEKIGTRDARVLATGRAAAHLLPVKYIDTVDNVLVRWDALSQIAGGNNSAVWLFDWILLDRLEQGHQTPDKIERILAAARAARYDVVYDQHGILLLQRPAIY